MSVLSRLEEYAYSTGSLDVTIGPVRYNNTSKSVLIPRVEDLHREIALALVVRPGRLRGPEIRFLRSMLSPTGEGFAFLMGKRAESISRWENSKLQIDPAADRLVRLAVAVQLNALTRVSLDAISECCNDTGPEQLELEFRLKKDGKKWYQVIR